MVYIVKAPQYYFKEGGMKKSDSLKSIACLLFCFLMLMACSEDDQRGGRGGYDGDDDDGGFDDDDDNDDEDDDYGTDVGDKMRNFTLIDHRGQEVSLYDFLGRVVHIDCSVAWCPACQEAMPQLESLYQKYRDKGDGLVILTLLAEDYDGNGATVGDLLEWIDDYDLSFPVLADPTYSIYRKYMEIDMIPLEITVDQEAIIRYKAHGFNNRQIEIMVRGLLGV